MLVQGPMGADRANGRESQDAGDAALDVEARGGCGSTRRMWKHAEDVEARGGMAGSVGALGGALVHKALVHVGALTPASAPLNAAPTGLARSCEAFDDADTERPRVVGFRD